MSTKSKKKSKTVAFLESITGGPLTLGKFIDAIREGEEWTKVEMAAMLGVSKSYYSDLIADRKSVSPNGFQSVTESDWLRDISWGSSV